LNEEFWRDLEWWQQHLSTRCWMPLSGQPDARVTAPAGTDASNYGGGKLILLDGAEEEHAFRWNAWEGSQPINWRELACLCSILDTWGERLRGMRLRLETDNMAAYSVLFRLRAMSASLMELVRRFYAECQLLDITFEVRHTPGAKLDQPDGLSRGAAPVSPRVQGGVDARGRQQCHATLARSHTRTWC
jgi:hypothetical protein